MRITISLLLLVLPLLAGCSRPKEYYAISDMQQLGLAADIFFKDNPTRNSVSVKELRNLVILNEIKSTDIVEPIHRSNGVPDYPNIVHNKYGTIADIRKNLDDMGIR
jgi:hypothetical protein